MSAVLVTVIDGENVLLADCDWVLWKPCGCAQAVTVADLAGQVVTSDEQAWKHFYDRKRDAEKAQRDGWRVELITYTQEGESGASLRAAGFVLVAERAPRTDHFESSRRYREDHGTGGVTRYLWERVLNPSATPWTSVSRPDEPACREMPLTLWEERSA